MLFAAILNKLPARRRLKEKNREAQKKYRERQKCKLQESEDKVSELTEQINALQVEKVRGRVVREAHACSRSSNLSSRTYVCPGVMVSAHGDFVDSLNGCTKGQEWCCLLPSDVCHVCAISRSAELSIRDRHEDKHAESAQVAYTCLRLHTIALFRGGYDSVAIVCDAGIPCKPQRAVGEVSHHAAAAADGGRS